jgi:5'-phosphate synthase pdxT subunit
LSGLTIGVLGFQGDIEEHLASTKIALQRMAIAGSAIVAKTPDAIDALDGLIIPGGESTVMGSLSTFNMTISRIKERIQAGMPALGTCAGVIMLAKHTKDRVVGETGQPLLGTLDIGVERNSFGRQSDSFEADLEMPIIGENRFRGVFIRAPAITDVGPKTKVLSKLDGKIVAVQEGRTIGLTFHPELARDTRLHEHFLRIVGDGQP